MLTSNDVPPMSIEMRSPNPSAAPAARAPTTPPTGPENSVTIDLSPATLAPITPPFDSVMCTGTASPSAPSACWSWPR